MNTIVVFLNIIATLIFVFGGLRAGLAFVLALLVHYRRATDPDYRWEEALKGRQVISFSVRVGIAPTIAGVWLLAAFLTNNLF